jgi:hypothetical protein
VEEIEIERWHRETERVDFRRKHSYTLTMNEQGVLIEGNDILEKVSLVSIVDYGGRTATAGNDVGSMAATSRKGREENIRQLHQYSMLLKVAVKLPISVFCGNVFYK